MEQIGTFPEFSWGLKVHSKRIEALAMVPSRSATTIREIERHTRKKALALARALR
jgi:hypothetical protein